MGREGNVAQFFGLLFVVMGPAAFFATVMENWKIRWGVWDRSEQFCCAGGAIALFVGLACLFAGCGGAPREVGNPHSIAEDWRYMETGTAERYLRLALERKEAATCEAMTSLVEDRAEVVRLSEAEIAELNAEYERFVQSGSTDEQYCGEVCQRMWQLIRNLARQGYLSCSP